MHYLLTPRQDAASPFSSCIREGEGQSPQPLALQEMEESPQSPPWWFPPVGEEFPQFPPHHYKREDNQLP